MKKHTLNFQLIFPLAILVIVLSLVLVSKIPSSSPHPVLAAVSCQSLGGLCAKKTCPAGFSVYPGLNYTDCGRSFKYCCLPPEPTIIPTAIPTTIPTVAPTTIPTVIPTIIPTVIPTIIPTQVPTNTPTHWPTPTWYSTLPQTSY
ncbi:MAG: hypothetical protein WC686_00420 [Candidatus Shapirobacteria bacterium]